MTSSNLDSTLRKVSEVERERLGEHVRVLTRRLRSAEETIIASEVALRSERKQNAELQKLLEKAHVELRSRPSSDENNAGSRKHLASASAASIFGFDDFDVLREELKVTKDQMEQLSKKREEDLNMYLKLASDSRRMFTQGLKEAFDKSVT